MTPAVSPAREPATASPSDAPTLYGGTGTRRITVRDLTLAKERGEKWPMLTAYDAMTASVFDEAGIPVILVGDSMGNCHLGYDSTVPVTMDQMTMLSAAVVRGTSRALVIGDMPFGSYQEGAVQALRSATRLVKEAGVGAVKLEGGERSLAQTELIVQSGIPVMSHLGLTPQSVNAMGYRVQGRGDEAAHQLLRDAKAAQDAGAFAVVLELVAGRAGRRGHPVAAHPDGRHRRGRGVRRAGAGVDRHDGPDRREDAEVRQAVREAPRDHDRRGEGLRRGRGRRSVPAAGARLPLMR